MVNALERWHRVQELCEALEAVPATRHAAVLEAIEPNPGLRADMLSLLRAFREESRLQGPLSGRAAESSTAAAPAFVARYRIVEWLGSGGSGDVFRAMRSVHGGEQPVVLKRFAGPLPGRAHLAQFIREQRILAATAPGCVAHFIDAGLAEDGRPFVVSELVQGTPITDYCDQRRLSLSERLRLMRRVCQAIQAAHEQLIVHLDLKPSNILVTADGTIKLLDFGTAKLIDAANNAPGPPSLTLLYASPEQLRGAPASVRCDIYSLGVILYELASGDWPFERRDTMMSVADRAVGHCDPLPLDRAASPEIAAARRVRAHRLSQLLHGDLDAICRKALAQDWRQRYATVADLEDDLRRLQADMPVMARRSTAGYRAGKFVRRNAWAIAAAAMVVLSLGTAALGTVREMQTATQRAVTTSQFLNGLFAANTTDSAANSTMTVRDLLLQAESRVGRTAGSDALLAVDLENALAAGFASQRGFHEALALAERAQARAAAAGDPARQAESHARASSSLYALHRPEEAWAEAIEAVSLWERASSRFSEAQTVNTLVEAATTMSQVRPGHPAPRTYYEACVAVTADYAPAVAGSRARCLVGLATVLTVVDSHYQQAAPLLDEALRIQRADPGLTGALAATLQMRGLVSRYQSRFADDERAQREAYDVITRRQGAESPAAIWQRAVWAASLAGTGRLDDADREAHIALAAARTMVPAENAALLWTPLSSVMTSACMLQRTAECEAISREAADALGPASPGDDPRLASTRGFLGLALAAKGQCDEARPLIESAVRMHDARKRTPPYAGLLAAARIRCSEQ